MLSRDQILIPIADAYFALLRRVDAWLGRPRIGEISVEELIKLQTEQVDVRAEADQADLRLTPEFVVLDVRSDAESSISMIPGAITKAEFERNRSKYDQRTVIPYCTVGGRSYLYARKLAMQGIDTVNFKAGIVGWCNAGLPLVSVDGQPTNRVRIADPAFKVPRDYQVIR